MSTRKLGTRQAKLLRRIADSAITGGHAVLGLAFEPQAVQAVYDGLYARKLIARVGPTFGQHYEITDAGRAALAAHEGEQRGA